MSSEYRPTSLFAPTLANKLGVLIITFLVMVIASGLIKGILDSVMADARNAFLVSSIIQSLLAFILPAWLAGYLCSASCGRYLGITPPVGARQFIGTALLLVIATPTMNVLIDWNANVSLPESWSELEKTLRGWEETAADTTRMILADTSVWGLVSGILVIGLLTGFAEECFFRAGIQRALTSCRVNHHIAIWTTAAIFSAVHFQFFGFWPRLILGALFGYLYYSSGSLWVNSFAHAFNNWVVVISAWLVNRGLIADDIELLGVKGPVAWLWLAGSLIATLVFICFFWKRLLSPKESCLNTSNKSKSKNG